MVAGGGTAGVVAALASARHGARTLLTESKGYLGGTVVEGGTALHSYYNLWKAFPGVGKRQVVRGIAQEIVDRLAPRRGTTGHAEMRGGSDYDSVCTAVDTEIYKLVVFEMLEEAGVQVCVNTRAAGMLITSDFHAHMSTRNTVCCMGQGQAAGTAAARPRLSVRAGAAMIRPGKQRFPPGAGQERREERYGKRIRSSSTHRRSAGGLRR